MIYWLTQNPECKQEYIDMDAVSYLKELNEKCRHAMLTKYLNYSINALQPTVKSREELLNHIQATPLSVTSAARNNFDQFNPYVSPSPRAFKNLFSSPQTDRVISPTSPLNSTLNTTANTTLQASPAPSDKPTRADSPLFEQSPSKDEDEA